MQRRAFITLLGGAALAWPLGFFNANAKRELAGCDGSLPASRQTGPESRVQRFIL